MARKNLVLTGAILAIALGGTIAGGGIAAASPGCSEHGGPGGGFAGPPLFHALHQLDLSDTQKQQVHDLMGTHHDEMRATMESLRQAHDALREASEASPLDETAIRAASAKVAAIEADLAVAHARIQQELRRILTEAQWTGLKQLEAEHPGRGMFPGPGAPPSMPGAPQN